LIITKPVPSLAYLPYAFGNDHIDTVLIDGTPVRAGAVLLKRSNPPSFVLPVWSSRWVWRLFAMVLMVFFLIQSTVFIQGVVARSPDLIPGWLFALVCSPIRVWRFG
jgi:hypothetical protein